MVHESMRNLRLDKRLARRRGWIPPEETQAALDALPDVADKGELVATDSPEADPTASGASPASGA